jgi:hypothetical protein
MSPSLNLMRLDHRKEGTEQPGSGSGAITSYPSFYAIVVASRSTIIDGPQLVVQSGPTCHRLQQSSPQRKRKATTSRTLHHVNLRSY